MTIRHPYRDNRIVELSDYIPRNKYNNEELRRFATTLMPREMAYAMKVPQSVPIREWLRGPLLGFLRDTLSTETLKAQGLFDHRAIQRLIDEHIRGEAHHAWGLWAILTVLRWEHLMSRTFGLRDRNGPTVCASRNALPPLGSELLTVDHSSG